MRKLIALAVALSMLALGTALAEAPNAATLTLTFAENPTTGYEWTFASGDEAVLTIADNGYTVLPDPKDAEGTGGTHSWTLTGKAEGDTTATFILKQNWEGGEETAKVVYTYHVGADGALTQTAVEGIPAMYMPDRAAFLLKENPTTGFTWAYTLSTEGVLAAEEDTFEAADTTDADPAVAGAGGAHLWVFKAVAPGDVTVTFQYARSWETGVAPEATVTYDCHVDENLYVTLTNAGGDYETYDLIFGAAN
jgi:predicted secreted protein